MEKKQEQLFAYIKTLKKEVKTGPMVENNQEFGYKIRILHRGEELLYQEGDKALICEIGVRSDPAKIFAQSIDFWDGGTAVTLEERDIIVQRIVSYFNRYQKTGAEAIK